MARMLIVYHLYYYGEHTPTSDYWVIKEGSDITDDVLQEVERAAVEYALSTHQNARDSYRAILQGVFRLPNEE